VLGYVTASNTIPWLYDLDADDDSDRTTDRNAGDRDACRTRAENSMFLVPLDPPFSEPSVARSRDQTQTGCKQEDFVQSFVRSLSNSVIDDVSSTGEWKLSKLYVRNMAVLGVALMLSQAPFYGVRNLQSSLNGSPGRWALVAYHVSVLLAMSLVDRAALSALIRPKTATVLSIIATLPFNIVAVFPAASFQTSVSLLLVAAAAVAGASTVLSMQDIYVTSLGASCAVLRSRDHRDDGKAAARQFTQVFSQYLLVMQQLSLLVGNFASSSVYLMTQHPPAALSSHLGR